MSGEEELTSSEDSSVFWECSVDLQGDRNDLLCAPTSSQDPVLPNFSTSNSFELATPASLCPLLRRSEHEVRANYFQKLKMIGMLPEKPRKKAHHGTKSGTQPLCSTGTTPSSALPSCPTSSRETGLLQETSKNKK